MDFVGFKENELTKFYNIAVLNRGEPATRFIKSARDLEGELGIKFKIFLFITPVDELNQFSHFADQLIVLQNGYLDCEQILQECKKRGIEAVWPGWGFLSERADFVKKLEDNSIIFIGPSSKTMFELGDKIASKKIAARVNFPITKWSLGEVLNVEDAKKWAQEIGFPCMIKASAGGGGRGIRKIYSQAELEEKFLSAQSEAKKYFGDDRLFLEKAVESARHIEIQIIADNHKNVFALGVRDCTMQRKNQKVIEESHSSVLTKDDTLKLKSFACELALACNYRNAGTVECLYDLETKAISFLEVNTRLQVEHPVTECISGLDLIKLQILVAMNASLSSLKILDTGHAIEVRVTADNPSLGFTPSPGEILELRLPCGIGIRNDFGFFKGDTISKDFDSMIGKIIAYGANREEAIIRLLRALDETVIVIQDGETNLNFCKKLLASNIFKSGDYDTKTLEKIIPELYSSNYFSYALIAAILKNRIDVVSNLNCKHQFMWQSESFNLESIRLKENGYQILFLNRAIYAEVLSQSDFGIRYKIGDEIISSQIQDFSSFIRIKIKDETIELLTDAQGLVRAQGPAIVLKTSCAKGDVINKGDVLLILEAMKMEVFVTASTSGVIDEVVVRAGQQVKPGELLVKISESSAKETVNIYQKKLEDFFIKHKSQKQAKLKDILSAVVSINQLSTVDKLLSLEEEDEFLQIYVRLLALSDERPFKINRVEHSMQWYWQKFCLYQNLKNYPDRFVNTIKALIDFKKNIGCEIKRVEDAVTNLEAFTPYVLEILQKRMNCKGNCDIYQSKEFEELLLEMIDLSFVKNSLLYDGCRNTHYRYFMRSKFNQDFLKEENSRDGLLKFIGKNIDRSEFDVSEIKKEGLIYFVDLKNKNNPLDARVLLYAKIKTSSVVINSNKEVEIPELIYLYLEAVSILRNKLKDVSLSKRSILNRIVIEIDNKIDVPVFVLEPMARQLAPFAKNLNLEMVSIKATMLRNKKESLMVINLVDRMGLGLKVLISNQFVQIKAISLYQSKILTMKRRGLVYAYEIINMLIGLSNDSLGEIPRGEFLEYDLDDKEVLTKVDREFGENKANVVIGKITNFFIKNKKVERILIVNDAFIEMGALAKNECIRIIKAIDLAQKEKLSIDWFTVSSGAKISLDSGTENLDWTAQVLRRIIEFTQKGGVINIISQGINVGAQSYWNAESTMMMHCKGSLIMVGDASLVLTGKKALEFSGCVSAKNHQGIGGYESIMGPNGEAHFFAPNLIEAAKILLTLHGLGLKKYPGKYLDSDTRLICGFPHEESHGFSFKVVDEIFLKESNGERKKSFSIRSLMDAVKDKEAVCLEPFKDMQDAEMVVGFYTVIGGRPVTLIGIDAQNFKRKGHIPLDGPDTFSGGTLYPAASKKLARLINSSSKVRSVVILSNLSGFDGSPESMRKLQLEFGAEIGRSIVNFSGNIINCVVSRYHGGAYVVLSRVLNERMKVMAVEGSFASVIGGAPAAAVVFSNEIKKMVQEDDRIKKMKLKISEVDTNEKASLIQEFERVVQIVEEEKRAQFAFKFDQIHSVERAVKVGSIHQEIDYKKLREEIIKNI